MSGHIELNSNLCCSITSKISILWTVPGVGGVIRGGGVGERSGCVVVLWRKQRCKIRREGGEGEDEEEEEEQWVSGLRRGGADMHSKQLAQTVIEKEGRDLKDSALPEKVG